MGGPTAYCLLIRKPSPGAIAVGRLGVFEFPHGYYVYIGSARKGLEARIKRHMSRDKRFHWHVDYLLEKSEVEEVYLFSIDECELSRRVFSMPGATMLVKKFGSSDCSCPSHLAYFEGGDPPELDHLFPGSIKKMFK